MQNIVTTYRLLFVLSFLVLSSCSTKKDAMLNRGYHQITAKYNAYFNGRESLKEGVKVIDKQMKDDFYEILPCLKMAPEDQVSSIYPQMDRAIEKCTKTIQNHSMVIRGNERNKWIDNNYMLIGIARFYKQEYEDALKTFDYVGRKFRREEIAFEARLWATRCHVQLGYYNNAKTYLGELRKNRRMPEKYREQLFTIEAEVARHEGDLEGAVRLMKSALDYTKKKKNKIRYLFIMAQLNQQMEEYTRASVLYKKVIKMNPSYDMEFYAKINRARSFDVYSGRSAQMKRDLVKMSEDEKNKEYLDEIYYAIADVYLRENNLRKGKEYLRLSASNSKGNRRLQTKIYVRLADMYFEDKEYHEAQSYYDSTLKVIPVEHERYEDIQQREGDLKELVSYLNIIHHEDSVLRIANLDEEDRNAFIDRLIAQKRREEKRKQEEEQQKLLDQLSANTGSTGPNTPGSGQGGWYFYNTQAISIGFTEFQSKWGTRLLEDNWRRKNKTSMGSFGDDNSASDDGVEGDGLNDRYSRNHYLDQLPLSDEAKAAAENKIIDAYYKAGLVYKDKITDYTSSIKNFEQLLKKYPANSYEPNSFFALYRLNLLIGVKSEAEKYKQLLLAQYPDSKFAKTLRNANDEGPLLASNQEAEQLYQSTFSAFKSSNFPLVISNTQRAISNYPDNILIPKFIFLDAISQGKLYGQTQMQLGLRNFINKFEDHELTPQAKSLLEKLGVSEVSDSLLMNKPIDENQELTAVGEEEIIEEEEPLNIDGNYPYNENMDDAFNYILVVPNQSLDMPALKVKLSDFNQTYFSRVKLSVKSFFLNTDYQLISIDGLKNGDMALQYYNAIINNPSILSFLEGVSYEHFVISQSNFGEFYGNKDVGGYLLFFKDRILNKK